MRGARGHVYNRKNCLGKKLSNLILTLTLTLTLSSFAELREELCLAGAGLVKTSQREGLQAVDVIMGQADTAGMPEVKWVYVTHPLQNSVGEGYICRFCETL